MKGKGGSVNAFKAKKIVRDQTKKRFLQEVKGIKQQIISDHRTDVKGEPKPQVPNVLDRFKPRKKKT